MKKQYISPETTSSIVIADPMLRTISNNTITTGKDKGGPDARRGDFNEEWEDEEY